MCFLQALLEQVSISDRAARSIWRNSFPFLSFRSNDVDFAATNSSYKSTRNLSSRSNCCLQSHLSQISSSAASSKFSRSTCGEFWHAMPLHWPHAGVHWRSFLKQVQDRVSHLPPQLHLMFHRSCAGLLALTSAQEKGLLRISSIPTPKEKDRSLSMLVSAERHGDCKIGRRLMSAEASLVVRIQLLWPLSFETSGALQFSDPLLGFHTW